ncbi:hypothetical protein E1B28_007467 [Marasmius oreades]|uniref:ATP-dependent (S)-NAD(P)H-hydrate dehydratase n=1 Tax=Marasmius oreades TaxID=181124 RepID=A0A9P7UTT5_9AGAR|nr:uncharacterized protein E1B28_007467 [Marasmius oreades]KAG7093828.1 hypothetical protein E1B28_007467 [Marasmius oreades]
MEVSRPDIISTLMPIPRQIFDQIKQLIPPLDGSLHKGQSGRVGVLGGALDYTGAPFFAAMSALRLGADLSHVICSPTAASAIKSYSPDLIVHPILTENSSPEGELKSLFNRLHVLIIGPGLGREPYMQRFASIALSVAKSKNMFLVLDADALFLLTQDPSLIKGYERAIVTPNVAEFKRLSESLGVDIKDKDSAIRVSEALGGVTVLQKGKEDVIATHTESENNVMNVDVEGGLKRCGGQGDILSGTVGTFMAWGKCLEDGAFGAGQIPPSKMPFLSAIGASMVTRKASRRAFYKEGRSVVTQDMLPEIGKAFAEVFGEDAEGQDRGKL